MRWVATLLAALAGCSFSSQGNEDAPVQPGIDGEVLHPIDADPAAPDARPDARRPPDAQPLPDAAPGTPDARPDAVTATCPGYVQLSGGFPAGATYKGVSTRTRWDQARSSCQGDGADLVVIDNAAEADAVATIVQDPGASPYFWVGVFDPNGSPDNDWLTVLGGAPPYLAFGANQPSGGNQDCLLVDDQGSPHAFWDFTCNATQVFVCECLP